MSHGCVCLFLLFLKSIHFFRLYFSKMDILTPEQLEIGLVNGTLDKIALEKLLTINVHENENIDTLVNFFLQYIPGNRTMDEFIEKSKTTKN